MLRPDAAVVQPRGDDTLSAMQADRRMSAGRHLRIWMPAADSSTLIVRRRSHPPRGCTTGWTEDRAARRDPMREGNGCCGGCCSLVVLLMLLATCACLASPLIFILR